MRSDKVILVMRGFKQQMLAKEANQIKDMTRAWLEIEQAMAADLELLARELADMVARGEPISQAKLLRSRRYRSLIGQVQAEWNKYARDAARTIEAAQGEWGRLGATHAQRAIQTAGAGVIGGFNFLPVEAIELMVGLLGDGSQVAGVLAARAVSSGMVVDLTKQLLLGTAMGWNPRKTARKMRDGLAGGLQKALTIARTEQMRVYREANRQQMQVSSVVSGYMRISTRDDRVCPACLALDGTTYGVDEVMPEHPNGRCGQVPVVIGVDAPQWEKGPEWFAGRPEATQRKILGNKRYEMWRDGQVDFGQMASIRQDGVWGESTQATPVAELAGG